MSSNTLNLTVLKNLNTVFKYCLQDVSGWLLHQCCQSLMDAASWENLTMQNFRCLLIMEELHDAECPMYILI